VSKNRFAFEGYLRYATLSVLSKVAEALDKKATPRTVYTLDVLRQAVLEVAIRLGALAP
jgi:hypothetical protein